MTNFVAFDDQAIWGMGESPESAMAEVEAQTGEHDTAPECETAEATPALAALVERRGGAVAFHLLRDGRCGTWEEYDNERETASAEIAA